MKKLILLFVLLLTAAFVNAQDVNFNLSMTVDEYIEVTSSPIALDFGTTFHVGNREEICRTLPFIDLAYANCPFTISLTGDNPANQGKPRFARVETGDNANGTDVLPTNFIMTVTVNNVGGLIGGHSMPAEDFPFSYDYNEAPHNGQVALQFHADVNNQYTTDGGTKFTEINSGYTNDDSADAGEYTCTMTMTLTAI